MARILAGTFPAAGHVNPFLPLVRALTSRGHEVVWTSTPEFRDRIRSAGARFATSRHVPQARPEGLTGTRALAHSLKYTFIDNGPRQLQDLQELAGRLQPDLVLCDPGFMGGLFFHERTRVPLVVVNILPMLFSSCDTAPFGLGLAPSDTWLGRLRNSVLNQAVEHVLFREVQQHWNGTRRRLGLPSTGWMMDAPSQATLYLQATVPGFEYPRRDLPSNVRYIGALPVEPPANWTAPDWWEDLDGTRPVVHVTQGTLANTEPKLIRPALEGLAGENVLVVVATGGASHDLPVPKNARVAPFLSYPALLPKTSVMVTNGGYGGTQAALCHGVPVVVAGMTEDKPEVGARVNWSGTGINLKTESPSPEQVRQAVGTLLSDSGYRQRAQALRREYAAQDAIAGAVDWIESISGGRVKRAA